MLSSGELLRVLSAPPDAEATKEQLVGSTTVDLSGETKEAKEGKV